MLEAPVFAGTHFILGIQRHDIKLGHKLMKQDHGTLGPNSSSEQACGLYATL